MFQQADEKLRFTSAYVGGDDFVVIRAAMTGYISAEPTSNYCEQEVAIPPEDLPALIAALTELTNRLKMRALAPAPRAIE